MMNQLTRRGRNRSAAAISIVAVAFLFGACGEDTPEGLAHYELLLFSDFEEYMSFDSPPALGDIQPLHWYLESASAHVVVDTTTCRSSVRSVKLIGSVADGSAIACGIPDESSHLPTARRMEAHFSFPDSLTQFTVATIGMENFEETDNVSAYIYITAGGVLCYATGNDQNSFDLVDFDVVALAPNEWYRIDLRADFVGRKYISFDIEGDCFSKHYDLSDKVLHCDSTEIAPRIGIYYYLCYWCPDTPPSGHCWFDDASLFVRGDN